MCRIAIAWRRSDNPTCQDARWTGNFAVPATAGITGQGSQRTGLLPRILDAVFSRLEMSAERPRRLAGPVTPRFEVSSIIFARQQSLHRCRYSRAAWVLLS